MALKNYHLRPPSTVILADRRDPPTRVDCVICHRGLPVPRTLSTELQAVIRERGVPAALERYRELRAAPLQGLFNFGEWSMNELARELAESNQVDAAVAMLELNAEFHPASPPLLFDAVRAAATPDERWLWLQRWARAAADAQGRLKPDPEQRRVATADELKQLQVLTTARSQAAAELVRAANKVPPTGKQALGNGTTARALSELALVVMHVVRGSATTSCTPTTGSRARSRRCSNRTGACRSSPRSTRSAG